MGCGCKKGKAVPTMAAPPRPSPEEEQKVKDDLAALRESRRAELAAKASQ